MAGLTSGTDDYVELAVLAVGGRDAGLVAGDNATVRQGYIVRHDYARLIRTQG